MALSATWLGIAAAAAGPCDPAVEGDAFGTCEAYCVLLECGTPEMAGEPACAQLLATYQAQTGRVSPPCAP